MKKKTAAKILGVILGLALLSGLGLWLWARSDWAAAFLMARLADRAAQEGYALETGEAANDPPGRILARDISLSDREGVFLRARELEMGLHPLALLSGTLEISPLTLSGAELSRRPLPPLPKEGGPRGGPKGDPEGPDRAGPPGLPGLPGWPSWPPPLPLDIKASVNLADLAISPAALWPRPGRLAERAPEGQSLPEEPGKAGSLPPEAWPLGWPPGWDTSLSLQGELYLGRKERSFDFKGAWRDETGNGLSLSLALKPDAQGRPALSLGGRAGDEPGGVFSAWLGRPDWPAWDMELSGHNSVESLALDLSLSAREAGPPPSRAQLRISKREDGAFHLAGSLDLPEGSLAPGFLSAALGPEAILEGRGLPGPSGGLSGWLSLSSPNLDLSLDSYQAALEPGALELAGRIGLSGPYLEKLREERGPAPKKPVSQRAADKPGPAPKAAKAVKAGEKPLPIAENEPGTNEAGTAGPEGRKAAQASFKADMASIQDGRSLDIRRLSLSGPGMNFEFMGRYSPRESFSGEANFDLSGQSPLAALAGLYPCPAQGDSQKAGKEPAPPEDGAGEKALGCNLGVRAIFDYSVNPGALSLSLRADAQELGVFGTGFKGGASSVLEARWPARAPRSQESGPGLEIDMKNDFWQASVGPLGFEEAKLSVRGLVISLSPEAAFSGRLDLSGQESRGPVSLEAQVDDFRLGPETMELALAQANASALGLSLESPGFSGRWRNGKVHSLSGAIRAEILDPKPLSALSGQSFSAKGGSLEVVMREAGEGLLDLTAALRLSGLRAGKAAKAGGGFSASDISAEMGLSGQAASPKASLSSSLGSGTAGPLSFSGASLSARGGLATGGFDLSVRGIASIAGGGAQAKGSYDLPGRSLSLTALSISHPQLPSPIRLAKPVSLSLAQGFSLPAMERALSEAIGQAGLRSLLPKAPKNLPGLDRLPGRLPFEKLF